MTTPPSPSTYAGRGVSSRARSADVTTNAAPPSNSMLECLARSGVDSIFEAMTSSIVSGLRKNAFGFSCAHLRLEAQTAESCSSVVPVSYL